MYTIDITSVLYKSINNYALWNNIFNFDTGDFNFQMCCDYIGNYLIDKNRNLKNIIYKNIYRNLKNIIYKNIYIYINLKNIIYRNIYIYKYIYI